MVAYVHLWGIHEYTRFHIKAVDHFDQASRYRKALTTLAVI